LEFEGEATPESGYTVSDLPGYSLGRLWIEGFEPIAMFGPLRIAQVVRFKWF